MFLVTSQPSWLPQLVPDSLSSLAWNLESGVPPSGQSMKHNFPATFEKNFFLMRWDCCCGSSLLAMTLKCISPYLNIEQGHIYLSTGCF